jgi:hypothetical protein
MKASLTPLILKTGESTEERKRSWGSDHDPNCKVNTDNYPTYSKHSRVIKKYIARNIKPQDTDKELPWVHISISNAK